MTKENHALDQARAQLESIVAMVAALNVDYDQLTELRELANAAADDGEPMAESDRELLAELEAAAGENEDQDAAREAIMNDPLELQVRDDWHSPGETDNTPQEFYILLCTGGPAVRIMGELDAYLQPTRAWIEYQDWGTPWTELVSMEPHEREAILAYCREFFFGE